MQGPWSFLLGGLATAGSIVTAAFFLLRHHRPSRRYARTPAKLRSARTWHVHARNHNTRESPRLSTSAIFYLGYNIVLRNEVAEFLQHMGAQVKSSDSKGVKRVKRFLAGSETFDLDDTDAWSALAKFLNKKLVVYAATGFTKTSGDLYATYHRSGKAVQHSN